MANNENAFCVRDCALIKIGTGLRARDLREFRNQLENAHAGCLYFHFWGSLLRPRFDNPHYPNDFADWVGHALNDKRLAERLGVIDPAEYADMEALRLAISEVVDERIDEIESFPTAPPDQQFNWIRSQIVVFKTPGSIEHPRDLAAAVEHMTLSSIFYHVIDARRRLPESTDDFRAWLKPYGVEFAELDDQLSEVDPYFTSLRHLRDELAGLFRKHFGRGLS